MPRGVAGLQGQAVTDEETLTFMRELDTLAGKLSENAKALREAAKALALLRGASESLKQAKVYRDRALDLLSVEES